jgi:hypothetical protein
MENDAKGIAKIHNLPSVDGKSSNTLAVAAFLFKKFICLIWTKQIRSKLLFFDRLSDSKILQSAVFSFQFLEKLVYFLE